jgi:transposase
MKGDLLEIKNIDDLLSAVALEKDSNVKFRLLFIKCFYENCNDLEFACETFGIAFRTAYDWISHWNKNGIDGLRDKPITGRRARLSNDQLEKLKTKLKDKVFWDIHEIKELIKNEFNVYLSCNRISEIIRNMKMTYTKPYRKDYRRPKEAEQILINSLGDVCKQLEENGIDPKDVVVGFLDEASPQNKANSGRFWSFGQQIMDENSTKYKANTIAFYSLNGNDVVMFLEDSKSEGISGFLKEIRNENPDAEYIIVVLDNFSSHKTELCKKTALEQGIYLVFLPPYSPDLNPIEFVWKSVRRIVSKFFIKSEEHLRDIIVTAYSAFTESISFASSWLSKIVSCIDYFKYLVTD